MNTKFRIRHLCFASWFFLSFLIHAKVCGQNNLAETKPNLRDPQFIPTDSILPFNFKKDLLNLKAVNKHPFISLQQQLKGNVAGTYISESNGEPGSLQDIFIRGISSPMITKFDLFSQQPVVYLNGMPLIQDNPFAYDIQKYDINKIGPANNLLSLLNINNIASILVVKDPDAICSLGPLAANGAIMVTTQNAHEGYREIRVNAQSGFSLVPSITPVNAVIENKFRSQFYNKYSSIVETLNYPIFLRDSTNSDYYGAANWVDLYYKNTPMYSGDFSLAGGTDRANFLFFGSATKNTGNADETSMARYSGQFFINVIPSKYATISSMISYTRLQRSRNRNVYDRLAEHGYIPDLKNPLTPYKPQYENYLKEFDKAIDDNYSNLIQGYLTAKVDINKIQYNGKIGFDYNENIRNVFWPKTLLENLSYVSNYFGYNQRFYISNSLQYSYQLPNNQKIKVEASQEFINDVNKYDYINGYNGPNDYIKSIVVEGDPNKSNYLQSVGYLTNRYSSRMESSLASMKGGLDYNIGNSFFAKALIRRDGLSNMQPNHKWFTGYSGAMGWNAKDKLFKGNETIQSLWIKGSYSQVGKWLWNDQFNAGPNYKVNFSWPNEPRLASFAGFSGISRPYASGWVGYNVPWAKSQNMSLGIEAEMFHNRLLASIDIYNRKDIDQLLLMPVAAEWGYTGAYEPGLNVNNRGVDAAVSIDVIPLSNTTPYGWSTRLNISSNKNKLIALPGGLQELIKENQKLQLGKPIDAFWVYKNTGIYQNDSEVPINPQGGAKLTFNGIPFQAGDPKWADNNNDFVVDQKDKVLLGNYMPRWFGGWQNDFTYKNFSLNVNIYFVLKRNVLNKYAASRLDFINTEDKNDINSVKEITYWEKKQNLDAYPLYNPWSDVIPYRVDQDLFLENASYVKLRSVTIAYNLKNESNGLKASSVFKAAKLYVTGSNLFTASKFNADDPELTNYQGYYTGYNLRLPSSIIIGCSFDF